MNICFMCQKTIPVAQKLEIENKVEVCFDCFFEGIPDQPSFVDKNKELKRNLRDEAIQKKASAILEKYHSMNPR